MIQPPQLATEVAVPSSEETGEKHQSEDHDLFFDDDSDIETGEATAPVINDNMIVEQCKFELAQYRNEPGVSMRKYHCNKEKKHMHHNILAWWKDREKKSQLCLPLQKYFLQLMQHLHLQNVCSVKLHASQQETEIAYIQEKLED